MIVDQEFSVDEGLLEDALVGTVEASDPDLGQAFTYSITAGNIDGTFAIDGTTGTIFVANSFGLDHETNPLFVLTVQVMDAALLSSTATVTISVLGSIGTPTSEPEIVAQLNDFFDHIRAQLGELGTAVSGENGVMAQISAMSVISQDMLDALPTDLATFVDRVHAYLNESGVLANKISIVCGIADGILADARRALDLSEGDAFRIAGIHDRLAVVRNELLTIATGLNGELAKFTTISALLASPFSYPEYTACLLNLGYAELVLYQRIAQIETFPYYPAGPVNPAPAAAETIGDLHDEADGIETALESFSFGAALFN